MVISAALAARAWFLKVIAPGPLCVHRLRELASLPPAVAAMPRCGSGSLRAILPVPVVLHRLGGAVQPFHIHAQLLHLDGGEVLGRIGATNNERNNGPIVTTPALEPFIQDIVDMYYPMVRAEDRRTALEVLQTSVTGE